MEGVQLTLYQHAVSRSAWNFSLNFGSCKTSLETFWVIKLKSAVMNTSFNTFQASVTFDIEIGYELQFDCFYMKYNTRLKWVKQKRILTVFLKVNSIQIWLSKGLSKAQSREGHKKS